MRDLDHFARLLNRAEAALWAAIATALLVRAKSRRGASRRRHLLAAAAFLAFGGSDLVEAEIGRGWWSPWWLFAWKAACVTTFLALALAARVVSRNPRA